MGTLTRKEMEQVINSGGSVLHHGQTLTRIEHLPTEAELAAGNPEQEAIAAAALDAQIEALQAQRARLRPGESPTIEPPARGPTKQGNAPLDQGTQVGGIKATPRGLSVLETQQQAIVEAVGHDVADRLFAADYDGIDRIETASDEQLLEIEGIGPATLKKLRALKR